MAWRIDEHVVRGEIDNRTPGRVTGKIWFVGREDPVDLDLEGNPSRDLAGHLLRFSNPEPQPGLPDGFMTEQNGVVGDITASRKVKVPDVPMEQVLECYERKEPFPWHWGNALYLEWYSLRNGRVLIETADFQLELDGTPTWIMNADDEAAQQQANADAMTSFMDRMLAFMEPEEEEEPESAAEAQADAEAAQMDQLLDRVTARLEREGHGNFASIFAEERARQKRELGQEEPPPTPEEAEEQRRRIDELNAITRQALEDGEADDWKEPERHPLVERCSQLGVRFHREIQQWLPDSPSAEHPLSEIGFRTRTAGAKLAGALGTCEDWPPDEWIAANVLVRLKEARGQLRDALSALDSADSENLATPIWRSIVRKELDGLLDGVGELITEARERAGE